MPEDDLAGALWIDLDRPTEGEIARMAALGVEVPSLADMEEIELSARLYREGQLTCMTVVLPGRSDTPEPEAGPVTFRLGPARLVTVRSHSPRPFVTCPDRAGRAGVGCADPDRLFVSLAEEIVGRLANLFEGSGKGLDARAAGVCSDGATTEPAALKAALQTIGRQTERIGRVRLALLTLERAPGFYGPGHSRKGTEGRKAAVKGLVGDTGSLEVHADAGPRGCRWPPRRRWA
jgi:magnesium transporter